MRFGGLIVAIFFAAIAAVVVLRMSANDFSNEAVPVSAQQVKSVNVFVAAKAIPVGTAITADMVTNQPWPEHLALEGFVRADGKTNVVGMVTRSAFQQNEPIILTKLSNPSDPNFLAGDLPKGMRIVTIPLNEVNGVAGFVFPGDRVDVIYTHEVEKWEYPPGSAATPQKTMESVTETILTNVTVAAVDQRASNVGSVDKNGNLVVPKSASLIVSQADAQRVRQAQKTGTISLALRSVADKESADPLLLTQPGDVTLHDGQQTGEDGVKIVRGAPHIDKETASSGPSLLRGAVPSSDTVRSSQGVAP